MNYKTMKNMEVYGDITVADMTIRFSSDVIEEGRSYYFGVTVDESSVQTTQIVRCTKEQQQAAITVFLYGDVGNEHLYPVAESLAALFEPSHRPIP